MLLELQYGNFVGPGSSEGGRGWVNRLNRRTGQTKIQCTTEILDDSLHYQIKSCFFKTNTQLPHQLQKQKPPTLEKQQLWKVFNLVRKEGSLRSGLLWLFSFASKQAKDFATGNNVIILSGALTYSPSKANNQTNQGTRNSSW